MKIHIFALRWKDEIRRSSQLRTLLKLVVVSRTWKKIFSSAQIVDRNHASDVATKFPLILIFLGNNEWIPILLTFYLRAILLKYLPQLYFERKKEIFPNRKLKDIDKIVPSKGTSLNEFFFITYFDEFSVFLDREWVQRHLGRSLEIVK